MPTSYSEELAATICTRIAEGESLRAICADEAMPNRSTVMQWVADNREGFKERYELAQDFRAQAIFDEMLEISDNTEEGEERTIHSDGTSELRTGDMLGHRKLKIEARKWVLARMAPKRYGDRIAQEISGPNGGPIQQSMAITPEFAEEVKKIAAVAAGMTPPEAYRPQE